jgi:predicted alpha-1,2-mannosidase
LCFLIPLHVAAQRDLTRYVDPFIGTGGHGHTFPGAIVPFGMVQLSPDTRLTGWDGCSGYHYSDSIVYGFSHTHLSGTGISDYGDVLLMPTTGEIFFDAKNPERNDRAYSSRFSHRNETASPGYYSVKLDDYNVFAELTATARAGMHRYTFPNSSEANIILDLVHRDKVTDSGLRVLGPSTVVGWRRSQAWARDQIVYFAIEFSQPFTLFKLAPDVVKDLQTGASKNLRAAFRFTTTDNRPILVKVGISAVSIEGAQRNLQAEINHWDFDRVRRDAVATWNRELGKITVTGGTQAELKNFYTSLYHVMTAPNLYMDVDGQYRGRDFKHHTAKNFTNYTVFSLWDTFRAAHPLYTIIDQKRTKDFINTFLTQYEQGGRLPVWELAANETETMIGYHAVSVIADAAAKGIDGFDREKALTAMKHSAELKHFGLGPYVEKGFIGMEEERESVSKTLEYAYDDWCIAEMARLLNRPEDQKRYLLRAQSYKNIFDPSVGFVRPRSNGGWFSPFEPREVNFSFTEANSWQYSFFAPQDVSGLIELMGGRQKFVAKLDQLFTTSSETTGREQADITGLIGQYAHGNEPSHHMAYLYNYAGQPWKTQSRVRQIMDEFYKPTPDGLIGNEDCGQMSAWYILSAAGFYPVTPGSTTYVIGTPLFPRTTFNLENGRKFVVSATGVSPRNSYVQSARLNGKAYNKSYIDHRDIMNGGVLTFTMGPKPNMKWGVGPGNEPVSQIDGSSFIPAPVLKASGRTFRERIEVSVETARKGFDVYYTTDGSEPTRASQTYRGPVTFTTTTKIRVVAIDGNGQRSAITAGEYFHIPHDWKLRLMSRYSSQYTGGGDFALIDGIRGTTNWSGGGWQGYQGRDLVAIVDLGTVQSVSKLGLGLLQDAGSWIWMPRRVEFEVSVDGQNFQPVLTIANDVPEVQEGALSKDFVKTIAPQQARYVRVRAITFGKIPSWHPGSGGDAWIFADEIIIE